MLFWAGPKHHFWGAGRPRRPPETIPKVEGGFAPPPSGMVFGAAGAAPTPQIDDFRPAQKPCIENPCAFIGLLAEMEYYKQTPRGVPPPRPSKRPHRKCFAGALTRRILQCSHNGFSFFSGLGGRKDRKSLIFGRFPARGGLGKAPAGAPLDLHRFSGR